MEKGGANKIGPALWDIVNKDIGSKEDYKYSNAMAPMVATGHTNNLTDIF